MYVILLVLIRKVIFPGVALSAALTSTNNYVDWLVASSTESSNSPVINGVRFTFVCLQFFDPSFNGILKAERTKGWW